jgi:hypothetical protein
LKTRGLFFLFVLLLCNRLAAQDSLTVDMLVPDRAIKLSPLHLMNFYPTIEISYEQKIAGRVTAQAELGYVLSYPMANGYDEDFQNKRGVKTKLEVRYYFWGRVDRKKMYYVSAEPYRYIINFDRQDERTECFDLECNDRFIRKYNYKMEYRENGMSVKAGLIRYFSNFFLDLNSGFTIRNIRYNEPDWLVPGFDDEMWEFFEIPNERDRVAFAPHFGIRIGYRLK